MTSLICRSFCVAALLLIGLGIQPAAGEDSPAGAPQESRAVAIPPGFEKWTIGAHTLLAAPDDAEWVKRAASAIEEPQRPTTGPTEIVNRISAGREDLTRRIARDLAIETDAVTPLFDEYLLPATRRMAAFHPPMVYLVCTRDRVNELLKAGWENPRFQYNRIADDFTFQRSVQLAPNAAPDETLIPVFYESRHDLEEREQILREVVTRNEREIVHAIADDTRTRVQLAIVEYLSDKVFEPLELRADQAWLGLGAAGYLTAKYASPILGVPRDTLLATLLREDPGTPVSAAVIDLLEPVDPESLRQEYVMAYLDAMRRKSTALVINWTDKGGDEVIPKTLSAMRNNKPADGKALATLIKDQTGLDLTPGLKAGGGK